MILMHCSAQKRKNKLSTMRKRLAQPGPLEIMNSTLLILALLMARNQKRTSLPLIL
ncbi:hypothetical protein Gohar_026063 [Gossypium harknessii]|uniref:Uncharacterized protein n=1 Tax=Gossypium harknessii TaxID=34285 RepID=A0A7J9HQF1_9ROSI|nr:hypothetical protein [Gossypium harknessii]